jgi:tetratricopeptide (TPR) repeat protein
VHTGSFSPSVTDPLATPAWTRSGRAREVERAIAERRFEHALPIALELRDSYPREPLAELWLAAIYRGAGRPADEVQAWERFIAFGSAPAEACPGLAEALARKGDPMVPAYERCVRMDPSDPERLLDLAAALERAGQSAAARETYQRASDLDPDHPVVVRALERLGRERVDSK